MDDLDKQLNDCGDQLDYYAEKMLEVERYLRNGGETTREKEEEYLRYGDKWKEALEKFFKLRSIRPKI